jgi:hypothetical protein
MPLLLSKDEQKLKLCVNKIIQGLKQDSLTDLTKTNLEELFWNSLEDNLVYIPKEHYIFFKQMWFSSTIKKILQDLINKEIKLPDSWEDK